MAHLFQCKWNQEGHINNANDRMTSRGTKWLSLLGDSSWLAVAPRKMKTHSRSENSFIVTNNFCRCQRDKAALAAGPAVGKGSQRAGAEMIIPAHSRLAERGC